MFLTISDVLSKDAIDLLRDDLQAVRWEDGAKTAGPAARDVKQNQQADLHSRLGLKIRASLENAIQSHPVLKAAAQPARFSKILVSKSGPGDGYGWHIDNPFMGDGTRCLRTDLSFTLFLTDPKDYEGGELAVQRSSGTEIFKGEIGDLVLYPATHLHKVRQVIRGERTVCVGWIESRVKQNSQREILFDLENVAATLSETYEPQSTVRLTLQKIIANLKREFD